MPIINISETTPRTHKLMTLKEAVNMGLKIPDAYLIDLPLTCQEKNFIFSLEDGSWLIRPSSEESVCGKEGAVCSKNRIIRAVEEVHQRLPDIQLILQRYIVSAHGGIMVSHADTTIETVCGCPYGLTRAGIKPSTYLMRNREVIQSMEIFQDKQFQILNAVMTEEPCGRRSALQSNLLYELYDMSVRFPNRVVEWCADDSNLYFLEYWLTTGASTGKVTGMITPVGKKPYDILLLPNARIDYYEDAVESRGVIARVGGYLCHLAVNCIEKGIPFVVSDEEYREGEVVDIDTLQKTVKRYGVFNTL